MKDEVIRAKFKYEEVLNYNAHKRMKNKIEAIVHYLGVEFYDTSDDPKLICKKVKKVKS